MATEIEHRFLVTGDGWRAFATDSSAIRQAYIAIAEKVSVRIRINDESNAQLTIKSAEAARTRAEFEYSIPLDDARNMMRLRDGVVLEKRRHKVPIDGLTWEIDVFEGALDGLVIAEIELPDEDTPFQRPDWLGEEVTNDRRYYNASLARDGAPERRETPLPASS